MASIAECVEKLVSQGQITRKIADQALSLQNRMSAEFSIHMPPASADAAAALTVAKQLRENAAARERFIANKVRAYREGEERIVAHPYGREAGLMSILTKDMWRTGNEIKKLSASSPVKRGQNVDYMHEGLRARLFNMFSAGMSAYRPKFFSNQEIISGVRNMVHEMFGDDTGDVVAKTAAAGLREATDFGVKEYQNAGGILQPNEDWRIWQHWEPRRVQAATEKEYLDFWRNETNTGGVKLWDKDTNKPALATDYDKVLKRAYDDIKTESGNPAPFSDEMRTFQFQPGRAGAESYLRAQAKFGVGNDIMGMIAGGLDHMARKIALQRLGVDAGNFGAWSRLVRQQPGIPAGPGLFRDPLDKIARTTIGPLFQTHNLIRATYDLANGKGNSISNEALAHLLGGSRNFIGAAALRNLPLNIVPGDTTMTFLGANHMGMSGFKILGEIVDGTTSKEAAQHLMINAHAVADFVNNDVRKYEDEINYSGLARKVSSLVLAATGATKWTTVGRRATMTSLMNQTAGMIGHTWNELGSLNPKYRDFLGSYGFDAAEWDRLRGGQPMQIGVAKYYLDPKNIDPQLFERYLNALHAESSFMFHQPDLRTRAFVTQGTQAGTIPGELMRSMGQFKQFAVERMTTHLMRVLIDGPASNRVMRGLAFSMLSMGAGAISLQAAAILAGKNPLDMTKPQFWGQAFAKGGAGGIYGDVLAAALEGHRGALDITGQLAGPLPGLAADTINTLAAPIRSEFEERTGRTKGENKAAEAIGLGRRFLPNTWYTRLAVDRLFWDKLQTLVDPQYRQSFRRAEDRMRKQGTSFWWPPGQGAPSGLQ
jgi:hypothetical protein